MTISSCIYADFGLIQDKDGYVNVRELADLSSKVRLNRTGFVGESIF